MNLSQTMEKNIQNVNIYKVKEIAAGLFGEPGNGQKVGPRAGIVVHVYTEKQIKEALEVFDRVGFVTTVISQRVIHHGQSGLCRIWGRLNNECFYHNLLKNF